MKNHPRLLVAIVPLLLASGFQQSGDRGQGVWAEFNSKEGAFAVLMPNKPTQEVQTIDTEFGKMETHLTIGSHDDSEVFMVSYADFPITVIEQQAINRILDGARNQLLANGERKLLSETTLTLNGSPGRELRIDIPDGNMTTRIFWVKRRLYQLIAITLKEKASTQNVDKFLASFRFESFVSGDAQKSPSWMELTSEAGGFKVLVPSKPTEQVMPVQSAIGSVDLHIYVSISKEGVAYIASYTDMPNFPDDQVQIVKALDEVRNGQVKNAKGKLLTETSISLDSYPGRELKIETPVGPTSVRIYLVKRRLYQIVAVVPEAVSGSDAVARDIAGFLSSFKLITR